MNKSNYTTDEKLHLFLNKPESYHQCFQNSQDEHNLLEPIQGDLKDKDITSICWIFNPHNQKPFPFDTDMLVKWFKYKPIHPLTREDISFMWKKINFMTQFRQQLANKLTWSQVTPALTRQLAMNSRDQIYQIKNSYWLLACYVVTPQVWEELEWIWSSISFDQTIEILKKMGDCSWLIRKSTNMPSKISHSELLVVAVNQKGIITQYKLLGIQGLGWFAVNQVDELKQVLKHSMLAATFLQALETLQDNNGFEFKAMNQIIPSLYEISC